MPGPTCSAASPASATRPATRMDDWTRDVVARSRDDLDARPSTPSTWTRPGPSSAGRGAAGPATSRRLASTSTPPMACGTPIAPPCSFPWHLTFRVHARRAPTPARPARPSPASRPAPSAPSTARPTTFRPAPRTLQRRPGETCMTRRVPCAPCLPCGTRLRLCSGTGGVPHAGVPRRAPEGVRRMYDHIRDKLARGETIILDGGTGTDIQRRGVPMSCSTWCAEANSPIPSRARGPCRLHQGRVPTSSSPIPSPPRPLLFNALGRDDELLDIDRAAVAIARQAAAGHKVAVAGSMSTMRPVVAGSDRTSKQQEWPEAKARALFKRKADNLAAAGVDLIMMEMMRDTDYSVWATEAAHGHRPVPSGSASRSSATDGKLTGFGREDQPLDDVARALSALKPARHQHHAHLAQRHGRGDRHPAQATGRARSAPIRRAAISRCRNGPSSTSSRRRNWWRSPESWKKKGVTAFGGCCGLGPDHIMALARRSSHEDRFLPLRRRRASKCTASFARCSPATASSAASRPATTCPPPPAPTRTSISPGRTGSSGSAPATNAQRGFCKECGSVLFWKQDGSDTTSISRRRHRRPDGCAARGHIFCESAGDYYEIAGGVPEGPVVDRSDSRHPSESRDPALAAAIVRTKRDPGLRRGDA